MTKMSQVTIDTISDSAIAGYALPAAFYTSEEVFQVDLDVFFYKSWILVGFEADLPEEGDARAVCRILHHW